MAILIGTAGWSIPAKDAALFDAQGAVLERYASRFCAVEVNSSFHRPHRPSTWARWSDLVPDNFRFAVKIPKTISHERKLVDCKEPLASFLNEVGELGPKLGVLLVQLPPKLVFEPDVAAEFMALLTSMTSAQVVWEPRHPSWFECSAEALLKRNRVARIAADPAPVPAASQPGGWRGLTYWRLHGSPVMYRSAYGQERIDVFAKLIQLKQGRGGTTWCMFDNTANSAATGDALALQEALTPKVARHS